MAVHTDAPYFGILPCLMPGASCTKDGYSTIRWIVIFSIFVKCLKNCENMDIDDTRSIKKNMLTYKY
jgi:hypothetical protein